MALDTFTGSTVLSLSDPSAFEQLFQLIKHLYSCGYTELTDVYVDRDQESNMRFIVDVTAGVGDLDEDQEDHLSIGSRTYG